MKKIFWGTVAIAIIMFIAFSQHPLDTVVNFVIGGVVPGTKIALGFWPMMTFAVLLLLALHRMLKNMRLKMIETTTRQIKSEQAAKEFKEQNSGDVTFDKNQRSVIAATSAEINL